MSGEQPVARAEDARGLAGTATTATDGSHPNWGCMRRSLSLRDHPPIAASLTRQSDSRGGGRQWVRQLEVCHVTVNGCVGTSHHVCAHGLSALGTP